MGFCQAAGMEEAPYEVPRIPVSAGALVFDASGRLLILKPTYKPRWTIPGGQVEAGGETPWEACRREAREESGLELTTARLVCVDFLRPREARPGGVRFLFDCGVLDAARLHSLEVQADEIAEFSFAPLREALGLLSGPLRRRVRAGAGAKRCRYLEDGRCVEGLSR
jgi:ADP-ribose pyrophosphatase YjhB (NUDIX family)